MSGQDEPINEVDFRRKVREIADGLLLDTLVTFVAMMRERDMTGEEEGRFILDEFAASCLDMAQQARQTVDIAASAAAGTRESLLASLGTDEEVSERVEALIEERRAALQDVDARDESDDGTVIES